jgi:hypothetical protein
MKKALIILSLATALFACKTNDKKVGTPLSTDEKAATTTDSNNLTSIQWLDTIEQDLGKVKEGTIVEVSYRFKNTGTKSLVIADVVAGCGCTVPEKPEQAFLPGEEGVIKAKFDSKGRLGTNDKYVTVTANTTPEKQQTLRFKVEVTN